MNNIELEEIKLERELLKKKREYLDKREQGIIWHNRDAYIIAADELLMKSDIKPDEVNYILGQSAGFVNGFKSAINTIVCALSSEYRDIPMTESELYMLCELGEAKERAWLKDYKQKQIIEKAGWEFDFAGRIMKWVKTKKNEEGTDGREIDEPDADDRAADTPER